MDQKQMEEMLTRIEAAIITRDNAGGHHCQCPVGNDRHFRHHELMDEIMDFFTRFKEMRWGMAKIIAAGVVVACLGVFMVGLVFKLQAVLGIVKIAG